MGEDLRMTGPAVELRGVSKAFAGIRALTDVSFDIRPGEVHALMGENGAGKSTLIKIMAGLHQPDTGEILVNGTARAVRLAARRACRGHRHRAPGAAAVSGTDGGREHLPRPARRRRRSARIDWTDHAPPRPRAARHPRLPRTRHRPEGGKPFGRPTASASRSPAPWRRTPASLIMDEPTAALAEADVQRLMDIVRKLCARGVAIVYVSHRMPEIFALADRVTVLRDGSHVGTKADRRGRREPARLHDGGPRHRQALSRHSQGQSGDAVAGAAQRLLPHGGPRHLLRSARAARSSASRGSSARGAPKPRSPSSASRPATAGEILIDGKPVTITSPEAARDLGIAYVPEDRGSQGLIRAQTIARERGAGQSAAA